MKLKWFLLATAVAGTLDLSAAFIFAGRADMEPLAVLQFVASGPLGDGALKSPAYGIAGILVHYGIMACMVAAFMLAATRVSVLVRHPWISGVLYGLLLWFVMYWLVRPMRWENLHPSTNPRSIAEQLFCHLILVGIPIALITRAAMDTPDPR